MGAVLTDGNGHSYGSGRHHVSGCGGLDIVRAGIHRQMMPFMTFSATDKDAQGNLSTPTTTTESV